MHFLRLFEQRAKKNGVQESPSICKNLLVLENIGGREQANGSRVAASVLETYPIGGQNEIADRIHTGDSIPGAFYGGALEGAEPEGRTKVRTAGYRGAKKGRK